GCSSKFGCAQKFSDGILAVGSDSMQSVEKSWFERLDQQEALAAEEQTEAEVVSKEEKIYVATPWQLMRWRFMRHRMAVVSAYIILVLYLVAAFCEFVAPYDPAES